MPVVRDGRPPDHHSPEGESRARHAINSPIRDLLFTIVRCAYVRGQLWYHNRPQSGAIGKKRSRYFSSSEVESQSVPGVLRLHEAIMSNGELDITDINLADMDPEDIRVSCERHISSQLLFYCCARETCPA